MKESDMPETMRAVQAGQAGGDFELVAREVHGVRPHIETMPLESAARAYAKMIKATPGSVWC
jgi:hypothetical protein